MITINLMFLLLFGGHTSTTSIKDLCGSNINVKIVTSKKIAVSQSPQYAIKEGGLKVPVTCAAFISGKGDKGATIFIHRDNEPVERIDSCFSATTIDNKPAKLCRYFMGTHEFLIAQIEIGKQKIDVVFERKDYDFAMELLSGITIEN